MFIWKYSKGVTFISFVYKIHTVERYSKMKILSSLNQGFIYSERYLMTRTLRQSEELVYLFLQAAQSTGNQRRRKHTQTHDLGSREVTDN